MNMNTDHVTLARQHHDAGPSSAEPKTRKACINCRKQKMKCIPGRGDTCRRCHRAGLQCIFVPRANAATAVAAPVSTILGGGTGGRGGDDQFQRDILLRVKAIEDHLGLQPATSFVPATESQEKTPNPKRLDRDEDEDEGQSLASLWRAVEALETSSPRNLPSTLWRRSTVSKLWSSFHERMPGFHFMPDKQTFSSPQPILVASMLYCSSLRGPPDVAEALAGHYFTALCHAIAQLSIPGSVIGTPGGLTAGKNSEGPEDEGDDNAEEWAFQTVLGIVLAGLLSEADVHHTTGVWLSIAYRLTLEHCPPAATTTISHLTEKTNRSSSSSSSSPTREWRKLFSGVQIVDLERASLHLLTPVIPIEPPLAILQPPFRDQLYSLSRMMHAGLSHFAGRRLPTIWSCFSNNNSFNLDGEGAEMSYTRRRVLGPKFTSVDAAVIRDWARQLDEWLVEFSREGGGGDDDEGRKAVFRQYVLHRLVVLSIYHPARDCNLWSSNCSLQEQHEMLLSARATLKLHLHDDSIWSNWDIVMITWAALIVIQGVSGGVGQPDDLRNTRIHLEMLQQLNQPSRATCKRLISRLEDSLQLVTTPTFYGSVQPPPADETQDLSAHMDASSWQIFDQLSLQQINDFTFQYPTN